MYKPLLYLLFLFVLCSDVARAQTFGMQKSVILEGVWQQSPPAVTLRWVIDFQADQYRVYRRSFLSEDDWGEPIAEIGPGQNSYTDFNLSNDVLYEYKVEKEVGEQLGYGYLLTGYEMSAKHQLEERILVFCTNLIYSTIPSKVDRLISDLTEETWEVELILVGDDEEENSSENIKTLIYERSMDTESSPLSSILLLGEIAVPYSGDLAADMIETHGGAWPADLFYVDPGIFTDKSVSNSSSEDSRNHNTPSDGKWDQSQFSEVEFAIGRIDFSDLPEFELSEIGLTAQYLDKNHLYRRGRIPVRERAIVEDMCSANPEGLSKNAFRNFGPIVGIDSIGVGDYRQSLKEESYLFSYGCGSGFFTYCAGVITVNNLKVDSLQSVFGLLSGEYFGDWDSPDNLLRSSLANQGTMLGVLWAFNPNWYIHPMGMGRSIGESTHSSLEKMTELYGEAESSRFLSATLIGDPTLRIRPLDQIQGLNAEEEPGSITLTWNSYPHEILIGYHVYRDGELLNQEPIIDTTFIDLCFEEETSHIYWVRSEVLEITPSGSYFQLSPVSKVGASSSGSSQGVAYFEYSVNGNTVSFENLSENGDSIYWDFGDGNFSNSSNPTHVYTSGQSSYEVELTVFNELCGQSSTFSTTVMGITDLKIEEENTTPYTVYPNPFSEHLWIENASRDEAEFSIKSLAGKILLGGTLPKGESQIDLELSSGIYIIEIFQEEKSLHKLLIRM